MTQSHQSVHPAVAADTMLHVLTSLPSSTRRRCPCRWGLLQQMQVALVPNATEGLLTERGWLGGCRSAPRPVNYHSWDEDDDSNACSPVTGYPGPVMDVSSVKKGHRFQVTVRLPVALASDASGEVHLGNVCQQNLLPHQQV